MKGNKITILSRDSQKEIEYTHIQTGSTSICFMFAGTGYTYDKPLLYYATMAMLEKNIDVVHIHYSYGKELFEQSFEDIIKIIMNDVDPVMDHVLNSSPYNETIFLAKSLGTIPIISDIMKREVFNKSKMILLTPLLKLDRIYKDLLKSKHEGLIVIGDKDPHYNLEQLEQIKKQTSFRIELIHGANHSLDVEEFDALSSISTLMKVIENLKETL
ncbi:alpha/beta family hydrolase [Psychrobacillus sp. NPDC096426]|uniref:alpha/beta family hydrolase n=1 Tax=Psychrobacillus sp. NPDC096426 TaxID=3364491 RepID=UPI003815776C